MSLPPLATVTELEARLGLAAGSLAGVDLGRAQQALDDASGLIRLEAGVDWVAADGVTVTAPTAVRTVARNCALRVFRNPDEYQSESVGSYSYQYAPGATSAYLTAAEIRTVRAAVTGRAGVVSIRTPSAYERPVGPSAPWERP